MISAHELTQRIRHPHRRPGRRRSHHDSGFRPALRAAGRGAFFAACPPDDEGIEQVILIPERPRVFWPQRPPDGYLGQLDDAFQDWLFESRMGVERDDCRFVHTSILSDGEPVDGEWDFRGGEDPCLGVTDFRGARVLELAPGSGYFTFHMERCGAEVVGFDVGWDLVPDVVAQPGDAVRLRPEGSPTVARYGTTEMRKLAVVQNSWWFLHRDVDSTAKMAYGEMGRLPDDLGVFDVCVAVDALASRRDPWGVLEQAASRTRRRIVVCAPMTDPIRELHRSTMPQAVVYAPEGTGDRTAWWALTPASVVDALGHLGFSKSKVLLHAQRRRVGGVWTEVPMYTVCADRDWAF